MLALFYDTETTGLPLWKEPSEHPDQPHIVQIAATLIDLDARAPLASIDLVTYPDLWTIPDEVAKIHGLTTERAQQIGVPEPAALDIFVHLWRLSTVRIAHNETFDARIVRIALKRYGLGTLNPDVWKGAPAQCTMKLARDIVKIPGTSGFKSPTLSEAYRAFFGRDHDDPHTARGDTEACMAIYFAMLDYAVPA